MSTCAGFVSSKKTKLQYMITFSFEPPRRGRLKTTAPARPSVWRLERGEGVRPGGGARNIAGARCPSSRWCSRRWAFRSEASVRGARSAASRPSTRMQVRALGGRYEQRGHGHARVLLHTIVCLLERARTRAHTVTRPCTLACAPLRRGRGSACGAAFAAGACGGAPVTGSAASVLPRRRGAGLPAKVGAGHAHESARKDEPERGLALGVAGCRSKQRRGIAVGWLGD